MRQIASFIAITVSLIYSSHAIGSQRINLDTGYIIIPDSSIPRPKTLKKAHSNYLLFTPFHKPSAQVVSGETPESLACIYGLTKTVSGCPIAHALPVPTGGAGTIAIVDPYDDPDAEQELQIFSQQFDLAPCTTANGCFSKVYAAGVLPPADDGWRVETALDIEWAHAMAPNAKIMLVEAADDDIAHLYQAEDVAGQLLSQAGGGEVSNSWGGDEDPNEQLNDVHFQAPGVIYLFAAGDNGIPASYPASSPYVLSVGGTSIIRIKGLFDHETAWNLNKKGFGGGGGLSLYVPRPAYQNSVMNRVGDKRGTPDISFDANPVTGVAVYTMNPYLNGWIISGGTSLSTPALAGIMNAAGNRANSSSDELNLIYQAAQKSYAENWKDITQGNNGDPALVGYDLATGLGTPIGYAGK